MEGVTEDSEAGFRELDHTADWELEVWARKPDQLLVQAAKGMYAMCGVERCSEVKATERFEVGGEDEEALLVGFLSDLLYLLQTKHLAFDRFNFQCKEPDPPLCLSVLAVGSPVAEIEKEIKAVTWHNISVEESEERTIARVTFDV
jgi:SHS2 domain-containing protein